MSEEFTSLPVIFEYESKCPVCNGRFIIRDYKYNAPLFGDLIISVHMCTNCGYKFVDFFTLDAGEPQKVIFKVETLEDANSLVVKSPTCRIEIPELGVTIEPGIYSQGYITTVEGLILSVLEITEALCRSGEPPKEACEEKLMLLNKAANSEIPYTLILYDHLGMCKVIGKSKKAIVEKLSNTSITETSL